MRTRKSNLSYLRKLMFWSMIISIAVVLLILGFELFATIYEAFYM